MEKHGLEGYAIWNLCLELLGKEGKKGILNSKSGWKNGLCKVIGWSDNGKLNSILDTMGELNLINIKSLKYGNLYIPKFNKRLDDYTARLLRTNPEQTTEKVTLEQNRIEQIRIEYIRHKGLDIKNFFPDDYARTAKAIKTLVFKAGGKDELVLEALEWISKQRYEWSLETLIKQWATFMKYANEPEILKKWGKK